MTWRFSSWIWRFLPGLASAVLVASLFRLSVLAPLERITEQGLFRLRGPLPWDERIVLIAIDDNSLQQLGRFPWSRQRYIELLNVLAQADPSVIAINLIWSESSPDDAALADAISSYGRVILAQAQDANGLPLEPVRPLKDVAMASGHVFGQKDPDGMVRSLSPQVDQTLALSLTALQTYALVREPLPLPSIEKPLWLNWVGPAHKLSQYSFVDVVQGRIPLEQFQNKIVLVSVTATGIDPLVTPFDQNPPGNGVHLHATAINNGLQQSFLQPVSPKRVLVFIIIAGPLISSLLYGQGLRLKLGVMVSLNMGWCLLALNLLWQDSKLPIVPPILLVGMTTAAVLVSEQLHENDLLKRRVEELWQAYHEDLNALGNKFIEPLNINPMAIAQSDSTNHRILQLTTLADHLGRSQSVQTAIARSLPIGLLAANMRGEVWFCNPQASIWLDVQCGSSLFQCLVPHWITQQDWDSAIQQLQTGKSPSALKVIFQEHWFELRWQPLLYSEKLRTASSLSSERAGFIFFLEDITAHKQTETALREAKEAAESASNAKSTFLANMSHELRTPLNAILGFSELMTRDTSLSLKHQDHLDVINRSGHHLLSLINNVLDMAKIEAGQVELLEQTVNLHRLLDELHRMLSLKADRKNLNLVFERQPDVPETIKTDGGKLRQILLNLLSNAIKFTQVGYIILRIHVESISAEDGEPSDLRLHFEVEDSGPGISASDMEQLFQPFEQTSAGQHTQEGTGLGLAISQQFVQLMGGEITVESTVGQGSTFRFTTLVKTIQSNNNSLSAENRTVVGLAPGQPTYRLLVVEDQADSRRLLTTLLNTVGFQVWEANNGFEGIQRFSTCNPHAVLMDMRMSIMNGYEAVQKIRATPHGRDVVIIAVTGSAFDDEHAAILAAGCNDVVSKPIQPEALFPKLATHLGLRYIYQSPEVLSSSNVASEKSDIVLQSGDLKVMPDSWINQLHFAALEGRDSKINDLITQIPHQHPNLISSLQHLTDNFQFEAIIRLTRSQQ
ncbi:MAG: CHASE2 domain-containing protein [Leptolyngbya sp. SIO1D8]|nr:CHASE2 domain-containing protein [Leptolyngbya sp. SIO1D8]